MGRTLGRSRGAAGALLALLALLAPVARGQQDAPPAGPPPSAQEPPVQPPPLPQEPPQGEAAPREPERPLVLGIEVEGERRYTEAQILAALGQRLNEPLDPLRLEQGIKRLWTSFRVNVRALEYAPVPGGVELRVRLVEMSSDREPRFVGNVDIETDTLERWALITDQTELYLHQARRVRQRLLEGYRREGYHFAEVNVVSRGEEAGEGVADVIFEIREGPKVRVKGIEIQGNVSMPDTTFLLFFKDGLSHYARRQLKSPGIFNWRGSPFVEEVLRADLLAMREVYRERGWLDAVVELRALDFTPDRSGVHVTIAVDEGPRYTVEDVGIEAVEWERPDERRNERTVPAELLFPEEELLELIELEPGDVLERRVIEADREALRRRYGKEGYISHPSLPKPVNWVFLPPEHVFDVERKTARVIYRVVQGRKLRLREVQFAGAHHTRDRVLRREVSVFPGEQADLEEIQRSLARIQGTGYFSDRVDRVNHRDPSYRFVPVDEDPSLVDLEFVVDEGRVVDFNITGGVDSNNGAFGLLSLRMHNFDITDLPSSPWSAIREIYRKEAFHGAGQLLEIELAPGTELSRYRLHFYEPDLLRLHLKPISLDLDLSKRVRRYDTHDEDRLQKSIKLGRKLSYDVVVAAGYVHTDVEVDDLDQDGTPFLLRQQEMRGKEQLAGATLDLSTRSLDSYILPRRGYRIGLNNVVYQESLGSDYDFVSSTLRTDFYRPTGTKDDGTQHVLHVEVDLGVSAPFGRTDDVPYTERYFLGGRSTLRGFDFRGVGPFDELSGFPLGGETTLAGSVEWWYPLHSTVQPGTYRRLETLRGTLFLDFGALDPDPFQLDPDELRASVGFGIGLAYPLPLQVNFGFPVLKDGDDELQVFSFSIGLP